MRLGRSAPAQNITSPKGLGMNQESFDCFLEWLDADREEAARKYEAIRRDLIKFFDSRVGAEAEDLADKTINIVIEKAPQLIDAYAGDPKHYVFRVALFKRMEYVRGLARRDGGPLPKDMPEAQSNDAVMEKEVMSACLGECLQILRRKRKGAIERTAGTGRPPGLLDQRAATANTQVEGEAAHLHHRVPAPRSAR
jgi:DNA-directed RNA polymerase specialized sigma24 family protein